MKEEFKEKIPDCGLEWEAEKESLICDMKDGFQKDEPTTRESLSEPYPRVDPVGNVSFRPSLQECRDSNGWDTDDNFVPEDKMEIGAYHWSHNAVVELSSAKTPKRSCLAELDAEMSLNRLELSNCLVGDRLPASAMRNYGF